MRQHSPWRCRSHSYPTRHREGPCDLEVAQVIAMPEGWSRVEETLKRKDSLNLIPCFTYISPFKSSRARSASVNRLGASIYKTTTPVAVASRALMIEHDWSDRTAHRRERLMDPEAQYLPTLVAITGFTQALPLRVACCRLRVTRSGRHSCRQGPRARSCTGKPGGSRATAQSVDATMRPAVHPLPLTHPWKGPMVPRYV